MGSALNGTGNASDNVITGNAGNNILDGATGNDTLIGGLGNDTYIVDAALDVTTENASEGTDLVQASLSWTLGSNVENLTLTGSSAINGTGNTLDNVLTGNSGNNTLTGAAGNDTLDGGTGTDTLIGGTGNDIYIVDTATDTLTENSGEGTDTVQASVTYTLGANLENLTLSGSSAINGTGNSAANTLLGNSGANTLTGADGNDILDGGAGNDMLVGGQGADEFRFGLAGGADTVDAYDTDGGADKLSVGSGVAKDQLWFSQSGNDLIMSIIGTSDKVTVQGWYSGANYKLDTIQLADGKYASTTDVEALRSAMAAFSPPPLGQTTLDPSVLQSLTPTLAASWH
jgi:Ca2+-binding RTX toxin-like protein